MTKAKASYNYYIMPQVHPIAGKFGSLVPNGQVRNVDCFNLAVRYSIVMYVHMHEEIWQVLTWR